MYSVALNEIPIVTIDLNKIVIGIASHKELYNAIYYDYICDNVISTFSWDLYCIVHPAYFMIYTWCERAVYLCYNFFGSQYPANKASKNNPRPLVGYGCKIVPWFIFFFQISFKLLYVITVILLGECTELITLMFDVRYVSTWYLFQLFQLPNN